MERYQKLIEGNYTESKYNKKRYDCNNLDDLLHFSFTLKISIISEAYI